MNNKAYLIAKMLAIYTFLLALCFIFYVFIVLPTDGADKVNAIIGLLSWSATLFTPIAAYILIDNWKSQIKYNAQLELIANVVDELSKLSTQISKIRNDPNVFSYLYNLFLAYEGPENNNLATFELLDFTEIFQTLENIRVSNLKIYIYDENMKSHIFQKNISGQDSYENLEKFIKGLEASFYNVKMHREPIDKGINSPESKHHLQKCLYISCAFANAYRSSINPSVDNIFLDELNNTINQFFQDIKAFRKSLN